MLIYINIDLPGATLSTEGHPGMHDQLVDYKVIWC